MTVPRKTIAYVETSVFSFFHEIRPEPEMQARRRWTQRWWEIASGKHDLVTSAAVLEELGRGNYPSKEACVSLASSLDALTITRDVLEIVETYIDRRVMPADPAGDALHLAVASFHRCDFLVTWNCRHLANANKFGHIRRVNGLLGLMVPSLVTPLELLGEDPDER